ncbi:MAG: T9SS type A sorting domain-containing protein [Bacteroidetes bacterium]|nr:T9SS type A sorting domain-containing protein [Bacteroidota bacterium]
MKRTFVAMALLAAAAHLTLAQWNDGQSADYVIGQSNFATSTWGISDSSFQNQSFMAIDHQNHKLYVADTYNNRVVRFAYPITNNRPKAEAVFGQPNKTTGAEPSSPAANNMYYPNGVAVRNGTLWVCDYFHSRVLRFDNAHLISSDGPSANGVLGQPNFTSAGLGTSQSEFWGPWGCAVSSGGTLWVSDIGNQRILRFDNAASKGDGSNADGVLGQGDFYTVDETITASRGGRPNGLCIDNAGRLWVSYDEHRILRFDNAASKANGAAADGVLGQSSFTDITARTTRSGVSSPAGVAVDRFGRLYVADASNSRVLTFDNAAGKSNGADADHVIGHTVFNIAFETNPTADHMNNTNGVAIDDSNAVLLASDVNNNRILLFTATGPLPVQLAAFAASSSSMGVTLAWSTATEARNAGFAIERRATGTPWEEIAFVNGVGTSNSPHEYTYVDTPPASGEFFYRLRQVDSDGTFSYHHEVAVVVAVPEKVDLAQNYPNPFNPTTVIKYQSSQTGPVSLRVYDLLGREVASLVNEVQGPGTYSVSFDASSLPSGSYVYSLRIGTQSVSRMMTLLR